MECWLDLQTNVYTVEQVNTYIRNMFRNDFLLEKITVKGEVSNLKYHSSGHIYFTLKDTTGAINCVMFRSSRGGLSFLMQEGQQVNVTGSFDVYTRNGSYQLYARKIELDGVGNLYEKYELLKIKLQEQGMFDKSYKMEIPKYIKTLGVVTASTGAAVRDIINITKRRNPFVQVILYPAIVQGDEAVPSIIDGIKTLEKIGVDVMIVGRGGGSIEDLWAFNDERVANAIFDCSIPIISAVGHETDTTIADYVADLRAPTPSAGAELAVYEIDRLWQDIYDYENTLYSILNTKINRYKSRSGELARTMKALSVFSTIRDRRMRQAEYTKRLEILWEKILLQKKSALNVYIEQMKGLSPLNKLSSGYSYVEDANGHNIKSINQVEIDDALSIHTMDGVINASVTGKEEIKHT